MVTFKKKKYIESFIPTNWNAFNRGKEILNINSWTIKMIESRGWILGRRSSSFSPRAIPRLSLYRKYRPGFQIIALVGRFEIYLEIVRSILYVSVRWTGKSWGGNGWPVAEFNSGTMLQTYNKAHRCGRKYLVSPLGQYLPPMSLLPAISINGIWTQFVLLGILVYVPIIFFLLFFFPFLSFIFLLLTLLRRHCCDPYRV